MTVRGIDINKWKVGFPFDKAAEHGIRFAYIRMSGMGGDRDVEKDPLGHKFHQRAREAGILVGAYHGLVPGVDARRQAVTFYDTLDDVGAWWNPLPPAIDVETEGVTHELLYQFMQEFWTLWEHPLWIYTSAYKWHKLIGKNKYWVLGRAHGAYWPYGPCQLWVADHRDREEPECPTPWSYLPVRARWRIWQYGTEKFDFYKKSRIDVNVWNGDEEQFRKDLESANGGSE